MPRYNHKKCEDDDDARRMSETILRCLGYRNVNSGSCVFSVHDELSTTVLRDIAQNAERIARWAREELKNKQNSQDQTIDRIVDRQGGT